MLIESNFERFFGVVEDSRRLRFRDSDLARRRRGSYARFLSHRVANGAHESFNLPTKYHHLPSVTLDPASDSWFTIQRRLGDQDAFLRRLTRLVLSVVSFQTTSISGDPWLNVGDLLIALLGSTRKFPPAIPSTSALAVEHEYWPWVLMLRGFLRESFAIESGGHIITIDYVLRLEEGSGKILTIQDKQPPTEPCETDLPNPVRTPGAETLGAITPAWRELQEWLTNESFFPHPVWKILAAEWVSRQHRYRRLFSAYCAVCHNCPYGGCCSSRFPKLVDIIAYRIQHGAFPPSKQSSHSSCPFLGSKGCSLLPGPMPGICCAFHCGHVLNQAPTQVRRLLPLLAEDADRVRRAFGTLWKHLFSTPPPLAAEGWEMSVKAVLDSCESSLSRLGGSHRQPCRPTVIQRRRAR